MSQKPSTVRHLDLDAILPPVSFTIKLNGQEHTLAEASVTTYLENVRDVENLGLAANIGEETEVSIRLVQRAFPTIAEAELRQLRLSQIQALITFARGANLEDDGAKEPAGDGEENPPTTAS